MSKLKRTPPSLRALHNNSEAPGRKGGEKDRGGGRGVKWIEARDARRGPRSCQHPSRSMYGLARH